MSTAEANRRAPACRVSHPVQRSVLARQGHALAAHPGKPGKLIMHGGVTVDIDPDKSTPAKNVPRFAYHNDFKLLTLAQGAEGLEVRVQEIELSADSLGHKAALQRHGHSLALAYPAAGMRGTNTTGAGMTHLQIVFLFVIFSIRSRQDASDRDKTGTIPGTVVYSKGHCRLAGNKINVSMHGSNNQFICGLNKSVTAGAIESNPLHKLRHRRPVHVILQLRRTNGLIDFTLMQEQRPFTI